jgi:hypothetical protein
MLNIKSLIAATLLSGVAALSFSATTEAPKAVAAPAITAAPAADAMAKPAMKKHAKKHAKKVTAAEAVAK